MKTIRTHVLSAACLALMACAAAHATEGGTSIYPLGAENFTCCALPPPGVYGMVYAEDYRSSTLKDNTGTTIPLPGFSVKADAVVSRLIYVFQTPVLGASVALHAIAPVVDLRVSAFGTSQTKTGLGDMTLGAALGWHLSPNLHTLAAFDVFAPTGGYHANDLANIGNNYWAEQVIGGVSWIDPHGFNADAKTMYQFNGDNSTTHYRSGQELIVDYALGWGVGGGFVVGAGGYIYQQTTDDKAPGLSIANDKGHALAIGPSVRYDIGHGAFATLKYQVETDVRNRAEGKALWLKAVFPL